MMGFGVMGRVLAGLAVVAGLVCGVARAETVLGVTQTSYDYLNRPVCVAVRMNPSVYGSLPTDACVPGTASATYGNDRITRTDYDAAGQAWKITQAYGTGDSRVYQVANHGDDGEVLDIIDARGNRSHSHYDGLNRLREFDYPSPTLATAYDPTSLASALATSGGYNTTACDTGHVADCEAYSYDLDNNRLTTRRRDAAVFTDCYDNLDRVVVHYVHASANCTATGGAADVYTAYDGLGRISDKHFAAFTGAQKVTYAYDGFGRVTSTTDMNGRTVGYQYNAASAVTRLTYADASYVTYTLDSANRIKFASHSSGASLYGQSFNSLGQRGKLTWGGSVGSVGYTWDHAGRLGTMTDDLAGTGNDITWTFAYSPASQVTSWSASSTAYDYKEYATSTVSQAYDGLNRDAAIVSSGGYDARGNMIKDASRVMAYDAENRFLTSAPVATPSSPNTTLAYDPEGRLASYTSVDGSGTHVTEFAYDGTDLIAEYDHTSGTPVLLRSYVHGPGADEPVVWFEGPGFTVKHFLAPNYQSSLIATADASGNLEATYEYGPYGEPEINRANPATVNPWAGPRFRYTGQTLLAGAQLYYYKARVYDPVYGHFLQTDPIGSKDDLDLYTYTGDDPVNKADPTGTTSCFSNCLPFLTGVVQGVLKAVVTTAAKMSIMGHTMVGNTTEAQKVAAEADSINSVIGAPTSDIQSTGQKVGYSGAVLGSLLGGDDAPTVLSSKAEPEVSILVPGPFAGESIPATSPSATAAEKQLVTQTGQTSGCHTCGTDDPGTKSGQYVSDHQPPTKLNPEDKPQQLYPHCLSCSRKQGGYVRQALRDQS